MSAYELVKIEKCGSLTERSRGESERFHFTYNAVAINDPAIEI